MSKERGPAIQLASGEAYYPLDPRPEEIRPEDIATHLSRICRFNGALRESVPGIYSVAQHSILVSRHVSQELAFEALLHAGHAYVVGDMTTQLKKCIGARWRDVELVNELALRERFGLPATCSPEIKAAARRALATEVRDLLARPGKSLAAYWDDLPEPWAEPIIPWTPQRARTVFMQRFLELSGGLTQ